MKGSHRIIVQNSSVKFDFTIRRNITILKGDSATGKTTLVEMVREHYERGEDSGVDLLCDKSCVAIGGQDWSVLLDAHKDSIIFIDEGNDFVLSDEFAHAVEKSDNYYIIVTREGVPNLPYSTEEIYGIRMSGKYGGLKPVYNEFYRIYGRQNFTQPVTPETVVVEDSNSGYEFYRDLPGKRYSTVISAHGKSNIQKVIKSLPDQNVLIIVDGAAFGAEIGWLRQEQRLSPATVTSYGESFLRRLRSTFYQKKFWAWEMDQKSMVLPGTLQRQKGKWL